MLNSPSLNLFTLTDLVGGEGAFVGFKFFLFFLEEFF